MTKFATSLSFFPQKNLHKPLFVFSRSKQYTRDTARKSVHTFCQQKRQLNDRIEYHPMYNAAVFALRHAKWQRELISKHCHKKLHLLCALFGGIVPLPCTWRNTALYFCTFLRPFQANQVAQLKVKTTSRNNGQHLLCVTQHQLRHFHISRDQRLSFKLAVYPPFASTVDHNHWNVQI